MNASAPAPSTLPTAPAAGRIGAVALDLCAVVVAVADATPRVLVVRPDAAPGEALPSGLLRPEHRTLERGLRAWVERQTGQSLGYVEQLYTFGDSDRTPPRPGAAAGRAVSVAYLALVREARPAGAVEAAWRSWYDYFPWEEHRRGEPPAGRAAALKLDAWAADAPSASEARVRRERTRLTFGEGASAWDDERVLERYELLYEAGLVPEAWRDRDERTPDAGPPPAAAMAADHRRILAAAIGRLRAKIKYRPVLFELMPPAFTLLRLQRTAEAISGARLHKQNFRRLVEQQGLVEETGAVAADTGGRPAKLVRFRPEVVLERPAPGVRVRATRRASPI